MGLLDNLFKPKPETAGEKSVENAESGEQNASSPKVSPFLAPKIYVPRSSVQIVPPARTPPPGDRTLAPTIDRASMPKEIVLTLGDVFSRIPTHFLKPGAPDLRRELRFPAEGLAADIARGRAAVFLADIVAQCPELFLPEVEGFDDIQIRLPLQKLVEQIGLGAVNLAPAPPPPPAAMLAPEAPNPAPKTPAPAATEEAQIHLSLAAIMRRCPREIIVHPLPPIEDGVRVTFPFAPIERQLSTGQVEVSSLRFIAALPLDLMKYFEARAGVKVPLPLGEIFQNLPNQTVARGVEVPTPATPPPPAEASDAVRENARLAESILLEPMGESAAPVEAPSPAPIAQGVVVPDPVPPEPPVQERETQLEVLPTIPRVEEAFAPELPTPTPEISANTAEVDLDALPIENPVAKTPPFEDMHVENAPVEYPLASAVEAVEIPSAPMEETAFQRFVPPMRPPVVLHSRAEAEPPSFSPPVPPPVAAFAPIVEPPAPIAVEPAAPLIEPVVPPPAPIPVEHAPLTASPGASTLRIGPPQFRPFVVHAPPIVLAPVQKAAFVPPPDPAPAPVVAESFAPPPIPEELAVDVRQSEPTPEIPVSHPPVLPSPLAPAPSHPIGESSAGGGVLFPQVCEQLAVLPGIHGCILVSRSVESQSGHLPADLTPASIRELSQRMRGALGDRAEIFRTGEVQHLTLHADQFSLSLFTRGEACVCAVHRARIFLPGVRERFSAVAEELGRGI